MKFTLSWLKTHLDTTATIAEIAAQGNLKKALELGSTKEEISDAIAIAVGIGAAAVVDMSDKAAIKLDLHHFEP